MITKKNAEKKGYKPIKVELELWIDPTTGNIFYPCDKCNKLFDRYIFLTDPTENDERPVNILCKDHKKRYHRHQIQAKLEALILAGAKIYLQGKWVKLTKKLAKEHEWFPIIAEQIEF